MPIKGRTDKQSLTSTVGRRLGKLYKGGKKRKHTKKDGTEIEIAGQDLKHFRVEFDPAFEHLLAEPFVAIYGKEPTVITPVYMAAHEPEDAFETWFEQYAGSTLLRRCDSEYQVLHYNETNGIWGRAKIGCLGDTIGEGCGKCRQRGKLKIVLFDLVHETGVWGYFQVETSSGNDIDRIANELNMWAVQSGGLTGIPFRLWRADHQTTRPNPDKQTGKVGRAKATYSLLNLQPIGDFITGKYLPEMQKLPALVSDDTPGSEEVEVTVEKPSGVQVGASEASRRVMPPPREEPPLIKENESPGDLEWDMSDVLIDSISVIESTKQNAAWIFTTVEGDELWCYQSGVFKSTPLAVLMLAPVGTLVTFEDTPLQVRLDRALNPFGAEYLTPGMLLIDPDVELQFEIAQMDVT